MNFIIQLSNGPTLGELTTAIDYFFTSPNHRYLSRKESLNSDGSKSVTTYKYIKDYNITSPSGIEATAISNLRNARRFSEIVEVTSSKIVSGVQRYLSSSLTTFQTLSGKIYPFNVYEFNSVSGTTSFSGSSSSASSFIFSTSEYVLSNTYQSVDAFGNITQVMGRNKNVSSVVYGYGGTLPVLEVSNAGIHQMKYASFDSDGNTFSFYPTWSYSTCPGRNGSPGIYLPSGSASTNYLSGGVNANKLAANTIFSFWAKSATNATVYLRVGAQTFPVAVTASTDWKYYSIKHPIENLLGYPATYGFTVWSSALIQVDDMAIYPETVGFISNTFKPTIGKTAVTDSRGDTMTFSYDEWGRVIVVYDRDNNILKTYDYRIKNY